MLDLLLFPLNAIIGQQRNRLILVSVVGIPWNRDGTLSFDGDEDNINQKQK